VRRPGRWLVLASLAVAAGCLGPDDESVGAAQSGDWRSLYQGARDAALLRAGDPVADESMRRRVVFLLEMVVESRGTFAYPVVFAHASATMMKNTSPLIPGSMLGRLLGAVPSGAPLVAAAKRLRVTQWMLFVRLWIAFHYTRAVQEAVGDDPALQQEARRAFALLFAQDQRIAQADADAVWETMMSTHRLGRDASLLAPVDPVAARALFGALDEWTHRTTVAPALRCIWAGLGPGTQAAISLFPMQESFSYFSAADPPMIWNHFFTDDREALDNALVAYDRADAAGWIQAITSLAAYPQLGLAPNFFTDLGRLIPALASTQPPPLTGVPDGCR